MPDAVKTRRFPPPWEIDDNGASFILRDHNGQAPYVYYEEEPGRRSAATLMTRDEARRIGIDMAKLPDLLINKPGVVEQDAAND
jgi:hypothetical protein